MTRLNLAPSAATALAAPAVQTGFLFRVAFPSLTLYATSMGFEVSFGGQVYMPDATLLSWGGLEESADMKARGVDFTLALRPDIVNAVMNDNWHLAPVDVWLVVFDASFVMVGSPYPMARSLRMSNASFTDSEDGSVRLTCETGAIEGTRDSLQLVSGPTQKLRYPGDTAFDNLQDLQERVIDWGGEGPRQVGTNPGGVAGSLPALTPQRGLTGYLGVTVPAPLRGLTGYLVGAPKVPGP